MRSLRVLLFFLASPFAVAATYVWNGGAGDGVFSNPVNWVGGAAPVEDGTATVIFGNVGAGNIVLPATTNLSQIQFQNSATANYHLVSASNAVLTLHSGISASGSGSNVFGSSVKFNTTSAETLAVNSGAVEIDGEISGSGSLLKTGSGDLKLAAINSIGGGLTLSAGTLTLTDNGGLGSGPLHLDGGEVQIAGRDGMTISNPIVIDANTTFSGVSGQLTFFSGNVTLAKSVTVTATSAGALFFSGNINESGGSQQLTVNGPSPVVLIGTSNYTGGTHVNGGTLVFGVDTSIPTSGLVDSTALGYVGIGFTDNLQSGFISRLNGNSFQGLIGFDTAPWQSWPTLYSENLNLSSVPNYKGLSTLTSAELSGQITVAKGSDYRFGGGGGKLYLDSNLNSSGKNLQVVSPFGVPLTLILRGSNSYQGATNVLDSLLILDRANTLPATSALNLTGPGYVGISENAGLHPNDFLRRIGTIGNGDAIAGIDSSSAISSRTVSDPIDLSVQGTRSDSYYLGTSSRVTLTGKITPPVGQSLSLTAIRGGYLTVASTLDGTVPALVVGQANSFDPQGGTVELTAANSYRGGTDVQGGTLRVSNSAALGLGGVSVDNGATLSIAANTTIANSLSLGNGGILAGTGTLASTGGVIVQNGAILSPGGLNSIGRLTFSTGLTLGGGGILDLDTFNSNSATLTSDSLAITGGGLTLAASGGSPFVISLNTLGPSGSNGLLGNFNDHQSYSWVFATSNNVSGFSSNEFTFDTSHFLNPTDGGNFFVSQNGNNLVINFTPVPEPSTFALLALGLSAVVVSGLRKKRR